jgi:hypothetical protein
VQSAVLKIARLETFPFIDLRVDDHPSPIDELHRLAALAERSVAPRLPRLKLDLLDQARVGQPVSFRVSNDGQPVSNIAISVDGAFSGLTGSQGELRLLFVEAGDYYVAAAQPPTATRAAASYQYVPAVRWVRVGP